MAMSKKSDRYQDPLPPSVNQLPCINASAEVMRWLDYYWEKLRLPLAEQHRLAVTEDRKEFHRWTGRRLNPLALGCYCYLPHAGGGSAELVTERDVSAATLTAPVAAPSRTQPALPGFSDGAALVAHDGAMLLEPTRGDGHRRDYRHLIFVEPDLLPLGIEVTVAHELIHLSDRVHNNPRKHHCHGYDSISVDEAAITGRDPELLRALLREETARRETILRELRPYRYVYVCPHCNKEYPRVRRYSRPVSCGRCDQHYNPAFLLHLWEAPDASQSDSTHDDMDVLAQQTEDGASQTQTA